MSNKPVEVDPSFDVDDGASWVASLWNKWDDQRAEWKAQAAELDRYLYATDTTTTSNKTLPWKNSTTTPKLTQIMDNLHSNYISSIFPNDKWLQWQAYDNAAAHKDKVKKITAYMENKTRVGKLRATVSNLLLDYIRRGNCFSMPTFERRYHDYEPEGTKNVSFIGPKAVRINPFDIVFDATAKDFQSAGKIVRSVKGIGELKVLAMNSPAHAFWNDIIEDYVTKGEAIKNYSSDEIEKMEEFYSDGFGSLQEYYGRNSIEVLEYYGDYHDVKTGQLHTNVMVTVAGRCKIARIAPIPTYDGVAPIFHSGWRHRPNNLWAMGPLDNLVGMQYRIDHLENLSADAMDLAVQPPLKIIGEVEEFVWGPSAFIHIDENGDVQELGQNLNNVIIADNKVDQLEEKMELFAGAPREAMGVRSPGEKTAFEIQRLENASGRIFQEKTTNFEITTLEPLLNSMLEEAKRNLDIEDTVSVKDEQYGGTEFITITKDDIVANGVIRPVGARHFAQQAQDLQNIVGIANTPLWNAVAPHVSGKAVTNLIEDIVGLKAYEIFKPNAALFEQKEMASLAQTAEEDLEMEATGPTPPETMTEEDANEDIPAEGAGQGPAGGLEEVV